MILASYCARKIILETVINLQFLLLASYVLNNIFYKNV